jgi:drug/metabolite transporter (DMT)-like permease
MPARARLALLTAAVLWAVSFVATKVALGSIPPLTVVSLRLLVSAACFLPLIALSGGPRSLGGRGILAQLFVLSLFGAGLHYASQTIGLQYTTASNASLYTTTGPITILLLSALTLDERITWRKAAGIAIAMAGVLVVMGPEKLAALELDEHILGDVLVLASLIMWGLFTVFGKRLTDLLGALRVTAWVTVIGAAWMAPVGWVEMRARGFSPASIPLEAWLAIAFLGVGCSFLATLLYVTALGMTESQKVGVYLYIIPPMTAVVAALYLGETISANLVTGAVLVIAGVALTERG